ncbi:MAG: cyclic pyranopterin monophosphate synthase MoaC, partial [Mailhella sp.]|nr:cyclic pyranopterin monophosphate synthase MoaC [Mailhella sp.]
MELSHIDEKGAPRMVDVGGKRKTERVAVARAVVRLNARTLDLLKAKALPKGDVLTVAQVAGIVAAKRTWEFIPLCHPLALTFADVRFKVQDEPPAVIVESLASTTGPTGVEMEAIIAAQMASATIYDMVKAVQKDVTI